MKGWLIANIFMDPGPKRFAFVRLQKLFFEK